MPHGGMSVRKQRSKRKALAKALRVVFMRRDWQGRVSTLNKFRFGFFE